MVTKWLAAFVEQGTTHWSMLNREKGFYAAVQHVARHGREIPNAERLADPGAADTHGSRRRLTFLCRSGRPAAAGFNSVIAHVSSVGSPYDVLGIDAAADEDRVVRAYRERIKESHPDHGGSVAEFKRVRRAYEHVTAGRDPDGFRVDAPDSRPGSEGSVDPRDESAGGDDSDGADEDGDTFGPTVQYLDYAVVESRGWRLTDDDLFGKAEAADLEVDSHGLLVVESRETLLEAAERYGFSWPYACRGGACANCAVAVVEGDVEMPVSTVLDDDLTDRGVRLSCIGEPVTDDLKIVFNIEHLPGLAELRLPAEQFGNARADD